MDGRMEAADGRQGSPCPADAGWSAAGWRKGRRLLGEVKKHLLKKCRAGRGGTEGGCRGQAGRHLLGGCRAERHG